MASSDAGNKFGDEGVIALAKALKVNQTLTELHMSGALRLYRFLCYLRFFFVCQALPKTKQAKSELLVGVGWCLLVV